MRAIGPARPDNDRIKNVGRYKIPSQFMESSGFLETEDPRGMCGPGGFCRGQDSREGVPAQGPGAAGAAGSRAEGFTDAELAQVPDVSKFLTRSDNLPEMLDYLVESSSRDKVVEELTKWNCANSFVLYRTRHAGVIAFLTAVLFLLIGFLIGFLVAKSGSKKPSDAAGAVGG